VPAQEADCEPGPDEHDPAGPASARDALPPAGGPAREAGPAGRVGLGVLYRLGVSASVLHPERAVLPGLSESTT
jgi:hypothetical protein